MPKRIKNLTPVMRRLSWAFTPLG